MCVGRAVVGLPPTTRTQHCGGLKPASFLGDSSCCSMCMLRTRCTRCTRGGVSVSAHASSAVSFHACASVPYGII